MTYKVTYKIPMRGLLGLRNAILTATKARPHTPNALPAFPAWWRPRPDGAMLLAHHNLSLEVSHMFSQMYCSLHWTGNEEEEQGVHWSMCNRMSSTIPGNY